MTAAGDVSDYDAAAQSSLVSNMATTLGVAAVDVSLTVTAASVRLVFSVTVADATAAAAVSATVASALPTATAASSLLGASVLSAPAAATLDDAISPPPSPPPPPPPPPPLTVEETDSLVVTYSAPKLALTYTIHAVLMGVAWLLLAPAGALISRFGKHHLGSAPPPPAAAAAAAAQGKPPAPAAWFRLHRWLMVAAVLLTVVGTAVSFKMVKGEHMSYTHSVLGVVVVAASLLQGANGAMRPAKDAPRRSLWRAAHRGSGHVLWVLGMGTSVLGAAVLDEKLDERGQAGAGSATLVAIVFAGLWAAGWALLEVRAALRGRGRATQPDAMAAAPGVFSKKAAVATHPKDAPGMMAMGPATSTTPTSGTAMGIAA